MTDQPTDDPEFEFDPDEDLFSFDEIIAVAESEDDKIDLEELIRVLNANEEEPAAIPADIASESRGDSPESDPASSDAPTAAAPDGNEQPPNSQGAPQVIYAGPGQSSPRVAKATLALLAAVIILNLSFFGVVWNSGRGVGETLDDIETRFLSRVLDIEQSLTSRAEAANQSTLPYVLPDSGGSSALVRVRDVIAEGDYSEARRRCYALLAVLDRFEADEREDIEAQATFLIADAYRRESEAREELIK